MVTPAVTQVDEMVLSQLLDRLQSRVNSPLEESFVGTGERNSLVAETNFCFLISVANVVFSAPLNT